MNIFYLAFVNRNSSKMAGVKKKINGQMKVFNEKFKKCFYSDMDDEGLNIWEYSKNNTLIKKLYYDKSIISGISRRKSFYKGLEKFINNNNVDVLYIRYRTSDPYFINFLRVCKKQNVRIYLEIPTFPYKKEISKITTRLMDGYYSLKLYKYVDKIITYSNHKEIFGIKTISINNAVDIESIPVKKSVKKDNVINLIGVANINFWHGYDRVIEGLNHYYQENNEPVIKFIILGEGKELSNLKEIVQKYNLEKYVIFKGYKEGEELNLEFNNADIGIVSLGIHRLGLKSVSTLKSKEYWARGLPLVKSYSDAQVDKEIDEYVLNLPANDDPVNIMDIINFYDSFEEKVNKELVLRALAEKNISWFTQLEPVITDILESN